MSHIVRVKAPSTEKERKEERNRCKGQKQGKKSNRVRSTKWEKETDGEEKRKWPWGLSMMERR